MFARTSGRKVDAELPEQETPDVGGLFELFAAGLALAVSGGGFDAQQDWCLRAGSRLQARRHFSRVHRIDAAVTFSRQQEHRRVRGTSRDVVVRRVLVE